jgi:hypothetical protein
MMLPDGMAARCRPRAASGDARGEGGAAPRILLVEDDEDTRQLLAVALEAQAYESPGGERRGGLEGSARGRFDMSSPTTTCRARRGGDAARGHARRLVDGAATLVVTAHPDPEG